MSRPFDPILVEVIRNQIAAITEEMTLTVYRTGRSGMCKVGDFATAVCDRHGRVVGEGGSPYQMCVFIDTMDNVLAKHGDDLKPGDIIIANDPYCGISHMPDITPDCAGLLAGRIGRLPDLLLAPHRCGRPVCRRHLQPVPVEL